MGASVGQAGVAGVGNGAAVRDGSGFRQRGHQATGTRAFVDAAFAFSLGLLVIGNDLPQAAADLRTALPRVPMPA